MLYDLHAAWPGCGENVTGAGDWSFLIHRRSYWTWGPRSVVPNSNYANAYNSRTLLGRFMLSFIFFAILLPWMSGARQGVRSFLLDRPSEFSVDYGVGRGDRDSRHRYTDTVAFGRRRCARPARVRRRSGLSNFPRDHAETIEFSLLWYSPVHDDPGSLWLRPLIGEAVARPASTKSPESSHDASRQIAVVPRIC